MPWQYTMLRVLGLVGAVCLGGYALALAQPNDAAPADVSNTAAGAGSATEESPLLVEPTTPEGIFDAAVLSDRLARPTIAKGYLEKLLEMNLEDGVLLDLRDKHGPAVFLRLSNNEELRPASTQLLERVNDAFRKRAADPAYVDGVISSLQGTASEREVAQSVLTSTGPVVVPRILERIDRPAPGDQYEQLVQALINMGKPVVPVLIAALDTPHKNIRSASAEALGYIRAQDALPYLWHPAFAEKESPGVQLAARNAIGRILEIDSDKVAQTKAFGAARELANNAKKYFRGGTSREHGDQTTVSVWQWSEDQGTLVSREMTNVAARLRTAQRFARQALSLSPENEEYQSLYLAISLANARQDAGNEVDLPKGPGSVHDLALTSGSDTVSKALGHAVQARNAAAAREALEILGEIATRNQLYIRTGDGSPIIAALNYPDQQVQFAAATTVLKLDPETRFRGSDRVVEILARALLDVGSARCVVVDPNTDRGTTTANLVAQLGYASDFATTGKEGFKIASEHTGVELILLHVNTIRWPLSATIANLRADARTANIPIVVYGPECVKCEVEPMLWRYPSMTYMNESTTLDGVTIQIRPFLESMKSPPLTPAQRSAQIASAAHSLAYIAESQRTNIYDLRTTETALTRALNDAPLSHDVLTTLSAIPSVSAQEQLQEFAISDKFETPTRVYCARLLGKHIRRYGLLLSVERVVNLEKAWREAANPEIATALATVVGSLKPNAARVGNRLQNHSEPAPSASAPATEQPAPAVP